MSESSKITQEQLLDFVNYSQEMVGSRELTAQQLAETALLYTRPELINPFEVANEAVSYLPTADPLREQIWFNALGSSNSQELVTNVDAPKLTFKEAVAELKTEMGTKTETITKTDDDGATMYEVKVPIESEYDEQNQVSIGKKRELFGDIASKLAKLEDDDRIIARLIAINKELNLSGRETSELIDMISEAGNKNTEKSYETQMNAHVNEFMTKDQEYAGIIKDYIFAITENIVKNGQIKGMFRDADGNSNQAWKDFSDRFDNVINRASNGNAELRTKMIQAVQANINNANNHFDNNHNDAKNAYDNLKAEKDANNAPKLVAKTPNVLTTDEQFKKDVNTQIGVLESRFRRAVTKKEITQDKRLRYFMNTHKAEQKKFANDDANKGKNFTTSVEGRALRNVLYDAVVEKLGIKPDEVDTPENKPKIQNLWAHVQKDIHKKSIGSRLASRFGKK